VSSRGPGARAASSTAGPSCTGTLSGRAPSRGRARPEPLCSPRDRSVEQLPWDITDALVRKQFLAAELGRALVGGAGHTLAPAAVGLPCLRPLRRGVRFGRRRADDGRSLRSQGALARRAGTPRPASVRRAARPRGRRPRGTGRGSPRREGCASCRTWTWSGPSSGTSAARVFRSPTARGTTRSRGSRSDRRFRRVASGRSTWTS